MEFDIFNQFFWSSLFYLCSPLRKGAWGKSEVFIWFQSYSGRDLKMPEYNRLMKKLEKCIFRNVEFKTINLKIRDSSNFAIIILVYFWISAILLKRSKCVLVLLLNYKKQNWSSNLTVFMRKWKLHFRTRKYYKNYRMYRP